MRQLLSVLFITLTFLCLTALASNSRRDYTATNGHQINPWEHNFSNGGLTTASLDSNYTILTFYDANNCSCGVGQFRLECLPDGYPQFNASIPINFTVEVQQKFRLTDVYIWIGATGSSPLSDYTQWDDATVNSGGVTFVYHNLHGFLFDGQFNLGSILSALTNTDGTINSCFRIEVVIGLDGFCGYSHEPKGIRRSPRGCNYHYEAIYPASDAYFHVGLNQDEFDSGVNNDTLFFKGYCLDPTRSIYPNYDYVGAIYSSYDPVVLNSPANEFVEAPQNFPYINYIANHEQEYLSKFLSGHQCSWQDVQNAIWRILFPVATTNDPTLLNILNNTSTDCVQWIVDDAYANGANYTPPCPGGKYLMILFPMINSDCNCTKDLETQLIAFPTGGSCLNQCKPKFCHRVFNKTGRVCLTGNCAPLPSPTPTASVSYSSSPSSSYSNTPTSSASYSSTASTSYSNTPTTSSSYSSTASTSYSNTPTTSSSYSSTASASWSSSPSYSSTASTSYSTSFSISSKPILPSTTNSATHTTCPSTSNAPSHSASHSPCHPSSSPSHSPCHPSSSPSHSPCHPSSSPSHSPCHPSRSSSHTPCASNSRTRSVSITSHPILPSNTPSKSAPCHNMPSASPSKSAPCHNMPSASPSKSAPCHNMPSASPSKSAPCHNMGSPSASPSMCSGDDKGRGRGHNKD